MKWVRPEPRRVCGSPWTGRKAMNPIMLADCIDQMALGWIWATYPCDPSEDTDEGKKAKEYYDYLDEKIETMKQQGKIVEEEMWFNMSDIDYMFSKMIKQVAPYLLHWGWVDYCKSAKDGEPSLQFLHRINNEQFKIMREDYRVCFDLFANLRTKNTMVDFLDHRKTKNADINPLTAFFRDPEVRKIFGPLLDNAIRSFNHHYLQGLRGVKDLDFSPSSRMKPLKNVFVGSKFDLEIKNKAPDVDTYLPMRADDTKERWIFDDRATNAMMKTDYGPSGQNFKFTDKR